MQYRLTLVATIGLIALTLGSPAALAGAPPPRVLVASPSDVFTIRPSSLLFINMRTRVRDYDYVYGPGSTVRGRRLTRLHWRRDGSGIVARGTLLTTQCSYLDGILRSCSNRFVANAVDLSAYRARHGRFTRLDIRFAHVPINEDLPTYELLHVRLHNHIQFGPESRAWAWCAVGDSSACLSP